MTRPFIDDDFLLETERRAPISTTARPRPAHHRLPLPPARPIRSARNHRFRSITEIWLDGDHYKWRAMRANGVAERFCTGDATDCEKFEAWAKTVPETLRNPLYHWTHMELKRPFGIEDPAERRATARAIFDRDHGAACRRTASPPSGLLKQFKVAVVCTTDDPIDSLEHHADTREAARPGDPRLSDLAARQGPRRRGPRGVERLGRSARGGERDEQSRPGRQFLAALERGTPSFMTSAAGPRTTASSGSYAEPYNRRRAGAGLRRAPRRPAPSTPARPCVAQVGAAAPTSPSSTTGAAGCSSSTSARCATTTRALRRTLGPDTGFDSIGDFEQARPLARFLDRLDEPNQLAKTILYNLNPRDNELFATMAGNFQDGIVPGKMQFGAAWWFLDQKDGMEAQMRRALEHGPALALRGDDHRLAQLPFLLAPRVLPAAALQPARERRPARTCCPTTASSWAASCATSRSSTPGTTSASPWARRPRGSHEHTRAESSWPASWAWPRRGLAALAQPFWTHRPEPKPFAPRIGYAAITWNGNDRQAIEDISAVGLSRHPAPDQRPQGIRGQAQGASPPPRRPRARALVLLERQRRRGSGEARGVPGDPHPPREVRGRARRALSSRSSPTARRTARPPPRSTRGSVRLLSEIGRRSQDLGVRLVYHNHMHAFSETPEEVARVLDQSEPRYLGLLLDIAHYRQGGGDPAEGARRHRDRLALVHLKDVVSPLPGGTGDPRYSYKFVELGRGKVDVKAAVAALAGDRLPRQRHRGAGRAARAGEDGEGLCDLEQGLCDGDARIGALTFETGAFTRVVRA